MSGLGEFRSQVSQGGSQRVATHNAQLRSQRACKADEVPGHVVRIVGSHSQHRDPIVFLQQLAMASRDPFLQDLCGTRERHHRLVRPAFRVATQQHVARVGWCTGREGEGEDLHPVHAVQTEDSPVGTQSVEGDQVPLPGLSEQLGGFHVPLGLLPVATRVVDSRQAVVAFGLRQRRQGLPGDPGASGGQRRHGLRHRRDLGANPRGQYLVEFRQGPQCGFADLVTAIHGSHPQAGRQGDGFVVVEHQRGQGLTTRHAVSTVQTLRAVHLVAELPEPDDVTPNGSLRDTEPFRQLRSCPRGTGLEQPEQPQHAVGDLTHESKPRTGKRTGIVRNVLHHCSRTN